MDGYRLDDIWMIDHVEWGNMHWKRGVSLSRHEYKNYTSCFVANFDRRGYLWLASLHSEDTTWYREWNFLLPNFLVIIYWDLRMCEHMIPRDDSDGSRFCEVPAKYISSLCQVNRIQSGQPWWRMPSVCSWLLFFQMHLQDLGLKMFHLRNSSINMCLTLIFLYK